jgi:glycosyltransferase involved in cell wall biosynthesis
MDLSRYDAVTAWSYRIERFLSKFADGVISNSRAGADIYKTRVHSSKVCVIPNGIDTDIFHPEKGVLEPLRDKLGIAPETKLVGLVARVDPMKDHETFLRTVVIVNAQQPDVQFVCIAANIDSPGATALKKLSFELGIEKCMHWAGPFEDMSCVYPTLDVVVLTSICGEGFPNVVAEAMACGVPCVVTDVGDAAVVVGDSGVVVPIGDADALASEVSNMLARVHDGREALSSEVSDRVNAHFSRAKLMQRSIEFMTKIGAA